MREAHQKPAGAAGERAGALWWGAENASPAGSPLSERMSILASGKKPALQEAVVQASQQGRG